LHQMKVVSTKTGPDAMFIDHVAIHLYTPALRRDMTSAASLH